MDEAHPHLRLIILYVGDHDPKGLRISEDDIPKRLADRGAINWECHRVAMLRSDAKAVAKTDRDRFKTNDKDITWYYLRTELTYGVEVEALSSNILRDRVEAAIREQITDPDAWNRTLVSCP